MFIDIYSLSKERNQTPLKQHLIFKISPIEELQIFESKCSYETNKNYLFFFQY